MTRLTIASFAALGFFAAFACGGANAREPCLDGLKPALLAGGFSGSTDCRNDELTVERVGEIRGGGQVLTVYDYRYQLRQICRDCAVHGGQRIIFTRAGRYIGQYKPDSAKLAIVGGDLVLTPDSASFDAGSVTVRLSRSGPPKKLWFDGQLLEFFR